MCTIGAFRLHRRDYLLFKNKDFPRPGPADALVSTPELCGPRGLETFAEARVEGNVHSGLSLGVNRHGLLAASAHVKSLGDAGESYDRLVEELLTRSPDLCSAVTLVRDRLGERPSWWGNLLLADPRGIAALEVRGRELRVEYGERWLVRTNHQLLFDREPASPVYACSEPRLESAWQRLRGAEDADDVRELLRSHDRGRTGVCNHGPQLRTVYAYLLHVRDGETELQVTRGNPCRERFHHLAVPLGGAWSREAADALAADYP